MRANISIKRAIKQLIVIATSIPNLPETIPVINNPNGAVPIATPITPKAFPLISGETVINVIALCIEPKPVIASPAKNNKNQQAQYSSNTEKANKNKKPVVVPKIKSFIGFVDFPKVPRYEEPITFPKPNDAPSNPIKTGLTNKTVSAKTGTIGINGKNKTLAMIVTVITNRVIRFLSMYIAVFFVEINKSLNFSICFSGFGIRINCKINVQITINNKIKI